MCLIVFAYKTEKYPLLIAGNRDEFYNRPTRKAQYWESHPKLLAGKDLKAGGTWMGVTRDGKFAALTNYRDISAIKENAPSRGDIVKNFLISDVASEDFLSSLNKKAEKYNGFNLIAGNFDELFYMNNQQNGFRKLEPGFYSISNAFLETEWPKTKNALTQFKKKTESKDFSKEDLFELLTNTKTYPAEQLPSTGLSQEMEKAVSSIFIKTPDYGTRCSTIVHAKQNGNLSFSERTYQAGSKQEKETVQYSFKWK